MIGMPLQCKHACVHAAIFDSYEVQASFDFGTLDCFFFPLWVSMPQALHVEEIKQLEPQLGKRVHLLKPDVNEAIEMT